MPGPSYELAFALYLLDKRIGTRRTIVVYDAIISAMSQRTPYHFFAATYRSKEEADARYALQAAREQHAETVAKYQNYDVEG